MGGAAGAVKIKHNTSHMPEFCVVGRKTFGSMSSVNGTAPGAPGITPRWTTSSKDGVGGSINAASQLTFTLSHGILNEIYFPREDQAATRDLGLLVTNGTDFFSEEKRDTETVTKQLAPGVPSFLLTNTCRQGRYRIEKRVIADPLRNTVLQRITFTPLLEDDYRVYALLAPHLANAGAGNTAWVGNYKGHPLLFAHHDGSTLALACSLPWRKRSVGFVGTSDGWQDLSQHYAMEWTYERAENGNVALTGEVDLAQASDRSFELAVGFGTTATEAAHHALSSLLAGFDQVAAAYEAEWNAWQEALRPLHETEEELGGMFRLSAQILRSHQSKPFPGAMIASLSIPWGNTKGDDNRSGYHLVWPRDLVESAGGLLALRAHDDVLRVLNYLTVTQEADGHWSQNMWIEGTPYWNGLQLDETALPILLVGLCLQEGVLDRAGLRQHYPAVRRALAFLLRHGIVTEQERWEEQRGISVFTLATLVAAVLAGAEMAEKMDEPAVATYCRQTADAWNAAIDTWLYVGDTHTARQAGVEGYYLRINPTTLPAAKLSEQVMEIRNKPAGQNEMLVTEMVSVDPLALVRFGLRAADDPRIVNTVRVIDTLLEADTPNGTAYYRYVNDGYGEHADGSAYDGTGIGRPWPLLAAERAHYELAAGNPERARELLAAVEAFSNNGLLSEQIWDREDRPEHGLVNGKHSGSAMPLVWAHAEHIKLVCSLKQGRVFDLPRDAAKRYAQDGTRAEYVIWRSDLPLPSLPSGHHLRIETVTPATVKWTTDDWQHTEQVDTQDMGLGVHYTDLPTGALDWGNVGFTIFWHDRQAWSGTDYTVVIDPTK